jgi:non-ribosomal peptide synthetase-like protein
MSETLMPPAAVAPPGAALRPDPVLLCPGADNRPRWRPGERLSHLFEAQCDRLAASGMTGHLAVDDGAEALTYADLDARANQLARMLLARGARPGDRIALLFDRAVPSYVAMLAVLKLDAAYVPLDAGFPADRLAYIASDARAGLVLTLGHLRDKLAHVAADVLCLDEVPGLTPQGDPRRLGPAETGGPVDQLAYIIYTSGSTGRPKGVAIEHAAIVNFVRVAAECYGIRSDDRVYQGMTIAFDFSVEETWVPWMAGATLVPKPPGASLLGGDLREFLETRGVTAMCCVPTLLATIDRDLPAMRFLLVSGEACPRDLIVRWSRPGRRFLNVYGPTEATVTCTWAVCDPSRPVTLGVPLPTYAGVVLHPDRDALAAPGELGELGVAGIGLAAGYVNRQDLTDKAFISDFLGIQNNPSGRIYRTGDLARVNDDGEIEYHGRIDTQVKIRGYRIELSEIESVLLQLPEVAQAVVGTYEPGPGLVELVGYYTLRPGMPEPEAGLIYEHLRGRLPAYMVPAYLEHLDTIPMLVSDKADRKALPPPRGARLLAGGAGEHVEAATAIEAALAEAMAATLGLDRVSADAHIFDDLGANSLLMAHFTARLRERPELPPVSMRDVYLHPTIQQLAASLEGLAPAAPAAAPGVGADPGAGAAKAPKRVGTAAWLLCGFLQTVAFLASTWLGAQIVVRGYTWVSAATGMAALYQRSLVSGAVVFGLSLFGPVVAKWLLVGRAKPAEFPIWSVRYVRFWLVKLLVRSSPLVFFAGSPLYLAYLRMLGARIGKGAVVFARGVPACPDLLTVGAGAVVRKDAAIATYRAVAGTGGRPGTITTGPVTIGAEAVVSEYTVLDIDTSVGEGAQLGHASSLASGQAIPDGERWHGSPAEPAGAPLRGIDPARCTRARRVAYALGQLAMLLLVWLPVGIGGGLALLTQVPTVAHAFDPGRIDLTGWSFWGMHLAWSLALFTGGLVASLAVVTTVPRVLQRLLRPGRVYPLYGFAFAVQRGISGLTNRSFFNNLWGDSSYAVGWARAIGYRLVRVIQTGSNFGAEQKHDNPYLTRVGRGTMVSDGLSVLNNEVSSTSFRLSEVSLGARSFFGNGVALPAGARTGDNCLYATKVMVPVDGHFRENVGLLGSPPFEIPRSVKRDHDFDDLRHPAVREARLAAKLRHNTATIGLFLLVRWCHFMLMTLIGLLAIDRFPDFGIVSVAAAMLAAFVVSLGWMVLTERAALGFKRLQPRFCSIYDPQFWRHERYWKLLTPALGMFNGTPFKPLIWRALGVRVGARVFDDGAGIPEKSLVTIGSGAVLNPGSIVQAHSLEDGAFKSGFIGIGADCTIGTGAWIHYGVDMGDRVTVEADSFLMKGEAPGDGTTWGGNPAGQLPPGGRRAPVAAPAPAGTPAMSPTATQLLQELGVRALVAPGGRAGVTVLLCPLEAFELLGHDPLSLLDPGERRLALAMSSRGRREAFVAGRVLVRLGLSACHRADVEPGAWELGRDRRGRPAVLGPGEPGVDISLSHAGGLIAVAMGVGAGVGIDVEPTTVPATHAVAWPALTPFEQARLAATPPADRGSQFARMWTIKESFAKLTGQGVALPFERLDTSFEPPSLVDLGAPGSSAGIRFHQEEWKLDGQTFWLSLAVRPWRG